MHRILSPLFLSLRSFLQWRILWLFHHKFMVGVAGVIFDSEQRVLVLKHRYRSPEMMWGLPSGYANRGERLEETLIREVWEETGYTVEVTSLIGVKSGFQLRIEAYYQGKLAGGELCVDGSEVLEAAFFPLDALPQGMPKTHVDLLATLSDNMDSKSKP